MSEVCCSKRALSGLHFASGGQGSNARWCFAQKHQIPTSLQLPTTPELAGHCRCTRPVRTPFPPVAGEFSHCSWPKGPKANHRRIGKGLLPEWQAHPDPNTAVNQTCCFCDQSSAGQVIHSFILSQPTGRRSGGRLAPMDKAEHQWAPLLDLAPLSSTLRFRD